MDEDAFILENFEAWSRKYMKIIPVCGTSTLPWYVAWSMNIGVEPFPSTYHTHGKLLMTFSMSSDIMLPLWNKLTCFHSKFEEEYPWICQILYSHTIWNAFSITLTITSPSAHNRCDSNSKYPTTTQCTKQNCKLLVKNFHTNTEFFYKFSISILIFF